MKRKQIYIDPEQEQQVKHLAARSGSSEAQVIRDAVARYLADELGRGTGAGDRSRERPAQVEVSTNPLLDLIGIAEGDLPASGSTGHDAVLYGAAAAMASQVRESPNR